MYAELLVALDGSVDLAVESEFALAVESPAGLSPQGYSPWTSRDDRLVAPDPEPASASSSVSTRKTAVAHNERTGSERTWAIEDCRHVSRRLEADLLRSGERLVRVPPRLMAGASRKPRRAVDFQRTLRRS
jgi:hypothetical protein